MRARRPIPALIAGLLLLGGCDAGQKSAEESVEPQTEPRKGRDGLYVQLGAQATAGAKLHQFLLGPGNLIARDPDGGVEPFDAAKADPGTVGTYRFDGAERMVVQWRDGSPAQTFPVFAPKNGQLLKFNDEFVSKAGSYPADAKINAIYAGIFGFNEETAGKLRTTERVVVFVEDGRFETSVVIAEGGDHWEAGSTVAGTYKLGGNTLALRFADGRETRHTVVPVGHDNQQPYDPNLAKAKGRYEWLLIDRVRLRRTR